MNILIHFGRSILRSGSKFSGTQVTIFLKSVKSEEIATLVFFILTGYKFRPGCNNPYFKVEEEDLAEVVTKTAITEKVQKRKDKSGEKKVKSCFEKFTPRLYPQIYP